MPYAQVSIPGDGVTTLVAVEFALGVISPAMVSCYVTGELDGGGNQLYRTFTFTTATMAQVNGAPAPIGQNYIFERTVPKDTLIVDWTDGDPITAENLDKMQKHSLHMTHEALDLGNRAVKAPLGVEGQIMHPIPDGHIPIALDGELVSGPTLAEIGNAEEAAEIAVAAMEAAITARDNAQAASASASASATLADASADAAGVSEGNAFTHAATADDARAQAQTHAANAAASATAASGSATAADASADAAALSEGNAFTHAGTASTAATNAANSASAAATSETNAAASATAAATAVAGGPFTTRTLAAAATIPATYRRIQVRFHTPNFADTLSLVGGAHYRRISLADLSGYPGASFFRSADRFMPDQTTDATNGGYWVVDEHEPEPEMFGAKGDGTTDDTAAVQAAQVYANKRTLPGTGGGTVYFRSGRGYYWGTGIQTQNGVSFKGMGQTPIKFNGTGGAVALIMYGNAGVVEGFDFQYTGTPGANAVAIRIGVSELAQRQVVRFNNFNNWYIAVHHKCAVTATIADNVINNSYGYGLYVENTVNADAGDMSVHNNVISNSGLAAGTGEAGIAYISGGGMRCIGNKILSFKYGFLMSMANGAHTVDLMFLGNSIENQSIACTSFGRQPGDGTFGSVTITGNEMAGAPIGIKVDSGVYNGSITSNVFNVISDVAIELLGDTKNWKIDPNNFAACAKDYRDSRAAADTEAVSIKYEKKVHNASTTTYQEQIKVGVDNFHSVKVTLFLEGIVQGAGYHGRAYTFIATNNNSAIVLTTVTDVSSAGGVAVDLRVDLASDTEGFTIGVRRNAGAGGTVLDGTMTIVLEGKIYTTQQLT